MQTRFMWLVIVFCLLLAGVTLAESERSLTSDEYCEYMLTLHNWKDVSFPERFPIQDGMISVDYFGDSAGYVKIENGSIIAVGCAHVAEFDYSLVIDYVAVKNILEADNSVKQYNKERFKRNVRLKGTDWTTKQQVRKLNRDARFFPWLLR